MSWNTQPRTLEVASDAFPEYHGTPLFVAARLRGVEKLGRLYDYEVDVTTIEAVHFTQVPRYVDVNKLVGKHMTVKIACEGNGTRADGGAVNTGADVREISGVIAGVKCLGADERRVTWRLRLRPSLWLLTLNRENRVFLDQDVIGITREVLADYPVMVRYRVDGPGYGRKSYPKRDYVRQWYESDWDFLNRLWQEWGITFFYDKDTLGLFDGASWKKHGAAWRTIRYLDRGGQRIDEEHIHKLALSRALTTGKVTVTDYDYTWGEANLNRTIQIHRAATGDNAEEYIPAEYAQPLQGGMGLHGERNDWEFEADHLARMRAEAHRCKSLRIRGKGNLRGLKTGFAFYLEGFPYAPANMEYVVTGTKIEIVNNDTVTQSGQPQREYTCKTSFTAQDANEVYRTPLTAKKPRAFAETAIVAGYDKDIICTDQMARLKLWMTWDRRGKRDGRATCWVPLSQPWQGNRYGAVWIPRVDDHVHVGYINEDPDRPFVLSSHTTNDNTTPWDLPGQGNDALSGWRSQDIGGKSIASNSVVTDDTPGRLQVQVASDQANSRFVAGFNTRIEGNRGRTVARGEGIEMATDAHGVVRANKGMLVTTETRAGATAPMMDMGETVARLTQARQQHEILADLAQQNLAQDHGGDQSDVAKAIKAQNDAIKGGAKTSDNSFPELSSPHLILSSPAGIETTTAESTHIASGMHMALTSGQHFSLSAGGRLLASVLNGVRLFCQKAGMKLVAASGDIDLQALKDSINILAKLNISHTANRITITAKEELLINGGGSYTRWNGGSVETGTNGSWIVHSGSKSINGPKSLPVAMPMLPKDVCIECLLKRAMNRSAFVNKGT
ncbi:type VI secretion system Vgr family protein [Paraburkholderia sp. B3]|uniref:type VI secretion system Vgr family protein n=1 Tax=Paraburkholderia sp. B3 TaxID=3134791 RepID=UPI0039828517